MDYVILVFLAIISFNIYQILRKCKNCSSIKADYELIHLVFIRLKNTLWQTK